MHRTRTSPTRMRLSRAVSSALMFAIAAPHVGAAAEASHTLTSQATSQARQAEYAKRLPDLGSDIPSSKKLQNDALLGEALAWAAQSRSSDALIDRVANAGLAYGLDAARASALPFLGSLQGGVVYDSTLRRFDYDLLTMLRLYGHGEGHTLLTQLGAHNLRDRRTANAGLVYRWIDSGAGYLFGANLFYDHDFDAGAKRLGFGVEAVTSSARTFANAYSPLSEWVTSPNDALPEERPAKGYDLGFAWTPQALSMLDLQVKGSKWQGDAVDVFNTGHTESDPTVWSTRVGVTPVPALSLGLEHSKVLGGEADMRFSLAWTHQLGVPVSEQWTVSKRGARNDLRLRSLAPVEREKRVIMDTREKIAAPEFATPVVQDTVLEGEAFEHALLAAGGLLPLAFTLAGADAARFQLSGTTLRLPAQDFDAPADIDADNIYNVIVIATDGRGRQTQQRIAVTVQTAAPTAIDARIEGDLRVGETLTLAYDYRSPIDEAEDTSCRAIQWFRRAPRTRTSLPMPVLTGDIAGATYETYVPVAEDAGYELGARVTVCSESGRTSSATPVEVFAGVIGPRQVSAGPRQR